MYVIDEKGGVRCTPPDYELQAGERVLSDQELTTLLKEREPQQET